MSSRAESATKGRDRLNLDATEEEYLATESEYLATESEDSSYSESEEGFQTKMGASTIESGTIFPGVKIETDSRGRKELVFSSLNPFSPSPFPTQFNPNKCVIFAWLSPSLGHTDNQNPASYLLIAGPVLRETLQKIFSGVPDFELGEGLSARLFAKYLFWARPELEVLANYYSTIADEDGLFEINAALKYIDYGFGVTISDLNRLLPRSINCSLLWTIFPPGCLFVAKDGLNFDCVKRCRAATLVSSPRNPPMTPKFHWEIEAECIEWNGVEVQSVREFLRIKDFTGNIFMEDLPFVPLKYHSRREEIRLNILRRNHTALGFWQPNFQCVQYDGNALLQFPFSSGYQKIMVNGRVIIDHKMPQQLNCMNEFMPEKRRCSQLRKYSRISLLDTPTGEQKSMFLRLFLDTDATVKAQKGLRGGNKGKGIFSSSPFTSSSSLGSSELSTDQILTVSHILYGFEPREGRWGAFAVDRIAPINWSSDAVELLILEPEIKDAVCHLVASHSLSPSGPSEVQAFVPRRGEGIMGLLSGPSGSGKTFAVEAIAEGAKLPIIPFSSVLLDDDILRMREHLADILKLASHWKAVLLLEHADLLMSRSRTVSMNRLVSAFLQEVESYDGIMFMTTNNLDGIDEKFLGKIDLSVTFPSLDTTARCKIWSYSISKAQQAKDYIMEMNEEDIRQLAKAPLNGRQIGNAVKLAVKTAATRKADIITLKHFQDVIRLFQTRRHPPTSETRRLGSEIATTSEETIEPSLYPGPGTPPITTTEPASSLGIGAPPITNPSEDLIFCQWEIPEVYSSFCVASPESSGREIEDFVSGFVVITGDEDTFWCTTCAEFLSMQWGQLGTIALAIVSRGVANVLLPQRQENYAAWRATDFSDDFVLTNTTEKEINITFGETAHFDQVSIAKLHAAITWICTAIRQISASPSSIGQGLYLSRTSKTTSAGHTNTQLLRQTLEPLKRWVPDFSSDSNCWTDMFREGVVAWMPLQRKWGKGLELKYETMIHLAAVENYYMVEGGVILLGYRTALVLVEHDEQSKSYQWHFETMDDSSEGFIDPSKLVSATSMSPKIHDFHDFHDLHGSKCFVGWFEKAHVLLGTKSLLDGPDQMSWSGTTECRQTLRPKGYEAGGQFGISAGPINIAPQAVKTWEFSSNVRKYDLTGQYRKTLRSCRRSVSIVIDSQTEQAWLVPTLSLILHLCHRYYQEINHTNDLSASIPFAEPTYDGHEAVLEAIEMEGDVIVLGEPGESDTETLRQLFLRIHAEFSRAVSTREEPKRGVIFATELMSIIDPPMAGSPLRKIDVSGSEALAASWEAIIKYVDVVGVCSGVGEPIRPELPAGNTCTSCPVLPRNHFYLAAHMQCLEALAYRASSSTNNLVRGSCVLGGNKTVWNTTAALWTNCSGPGHVSIWSKRPPYHVLQHISDDEEKTRHSVILRNPVTRTGVVVFGDRKKALNPVKRLLGGVQIKLATLRNGAAQ